jgi:DNA-binding IclR family transcriptional regulator
MEAPELPRPPVTRAGRARNSAKPSEPPVPARTVIRALSILKAFKQTSPVLSLSEVVRATGLDKGTTRRLLLTLQQQGFVTIDAETQRFTLGPAVLKLASAVTSKDFRETMRPILMRLGNETKATVHLSIPRDDGAVCIDRFQPEEAAVLVHHWAVGSRCPFNGGAAPRVLFASLSDEEIESFLSNPEKHRHLNRPVNIAAMRRSVAEIRKTGWAMSADEVAPGLTAIGAPIRGPKGDVVAAFSLVGLSPQLMESPERYRDQILHAAKLASELIV